MCDRYEMEKLGLPILTSQSVCWYVRLLVHPSDTRVSEKGMMRLEAGGFRQSVIYGKHLMSCVLYKITPLVFHYTVK